MRKHLFILIALLSITTTVLGKCCNQIGSAGKVTDCSVGQNWKMLSRQSFSSSPTALTLSKPGNYMLTETYTDSSENALTAMISITADDVVLDLGGHSIVGGGASTGVGISIASSANNIIIQNGTIRETGNNGIAIATGARDILIKNVGINNTFSADCIEIAGGANIVLQNITITADGASTGMGIDISDTVQNFTLENFNISGMSGSNTHGINIASSSYGIHIKCGKISNIGNANTSNGINFGTGCYDIKIENTSLSNINGEGIDLRNAHAVTINNIQMANIAGGYALNVSSTGYNIELNNFSFSNINTASTGGGIALSSGVDGITIRNGTIVGVTNTTGYGITMIGSQGVIIENVHIANTADQGIIMQTTECQNILIKNVHITGTTSNAIDINTACKGVFIDDAKLAGVSGIGVNIAGTSQNIKVKGVETASASSGVTIEGAANGIIIEDCSFHTPTNGIVISGAAHSIVAQRFKISGSSSHGIAISAAAYGLRFKDFNIANITTNGVSIGAACYDLRFEDFEIANAGGNGFNFSTAGSYNVVIKNGIIGKTGTGAAGAVINVTNNCYGFFIENIQAANSPSGIVFDGNSDSTTITDVTLKDCSLSNITSTNGTGVKFIHTEGILMENCVISNVNNVNSSSNVSGILFNTCTNIKCLHVESGSNTGDGVSGFNLTSVNGAYFKDCRSHGNHAVDSLGTFTCAGFFVTTSTATVFDQCITSGNQAPREAAGFYLNRANGTIFNKCIANQNTMVNSSGNNAAHFSGFYSKLGYGNSWNKCEAYKQHAGNTATRDGYGAIGFYTSAEKQASFLKCIARGNGSTTQHAANSAGFYLDDSVGNSDSQHCQIRECEASSNCTSATSGTTAYGFRDDSTDTTNMILDCFAFGNTDQASPRVITNYYIDLPIGGTTQGNWPLVEANMDGILDLANKPLFYNVGITN